MVADARDGKPAGLAKEVVTESGEVVQGVVVDGTTGVDPSTDRLYVARAAVVLLRLEDDAESMFTGPQARELSAEITANLRRALRNDPRVVEVYPETDAGLDNARTSTFLEIHGDSENLADAVSMYEAFRFNEDIAFRLRVPVKNQPRWRNRDDVPSDEYIVVWDGITMLVQWDQDDQRATGSGGHIAFDVITEVSEQAGYSCEIVACTPSCHHRFLHADFVTFDEVDSPEHFKRSRRTPVGSSIVVPFRRLDDPLHNARAVYASLGSAYSVFAEAKTLSDSIIFLERRARADSARLLSIAYERVSRGSPFSKQGLIDRWRGRGARREVRRILAGLWLALAFVEMQLRDWQSRVALLHELIAESKLSDLEDDFDTDEAFINALDMDFVRSTIEHTQQRYEARILVIATASGAAAAVSGAAAAALLT